MVREQFTVVRTLIVESPLFGPCLKRITPPYVCRVRKGHVRKRKRKITQHGFGVREVLYSSFDLITSSYIGMIFVIELYRYIQCLIFMVRGPA